jgi:hypothetical protein
VRAAIQAKTLELTQGDCSKRIRQKTNSKIPSRKKMGIVAIEQQIRQEGQHKHLRKEDLARETGTNQPTLDNFLVKRPHPASTMTSLKSNKRLRKPD